MIGYYFHPSHVPSRGSLALWVFAATGQACVLKSSENLPAKLPKTIFRVHGSKAPGKFGPVKSLVILPRKVTGARTLAKTFSGNLLAIKWLLLEHFFKGLFNEKIKWSIDRFRDKMIEQNTDRKFSESFTRMHACVNTMIDASLFVFAKSSPTAILVL